MKKLNRKNLIAFANSLLYTKDGYEYWVPLCKEKFKKQYNGEYMCCILGALYEEFVGPIDNTTVDITNSIFNKMRSDTADVAFSILLNSMLDNDNAKNYYERAKVAQLNLFKLAKYLK